MILQIWLTGAPLCLLSSGRKVLLLFQMGNLIKEDLDVPCDYQYLVVFLKQVPESASLKYHIG